jgi:hypothetical protein
MVRTLNFFKTDDFLTRNNIHVVFIEDVRNYILRATINQEGVQIDLIHLRNFSAAYGFESVELHVYYVLIKKTIYHTSNLNTKHEV